MKVEDLRKEFGDKYSEKIRSEIVQYNPDYVHFLEHKIIELLSKNNNPNDYGIIKKMELNG